MSERVRVLAECGGVDVKLVLELRSTTLLRWLFRHSSLVLCSCLILQVMAPKAYLTDKAKPESLQRRRAKSLEALLAKVLGGVAWMELHAVLPWSWKVAQNQLRSIGPPLFPTSKRRRACSCFNERETMFAWTGTVSAARS